MRPGRLPENDPLERAARARLRLPSTQPEPERPAAPDQPNAEQPVVPLSRRRTMPRQRPRRLPQRRWT